MTRVLLTGGSGFIALHVLEILLEHGHSVVTTVRSQDKAEKIRKSFPNAGKGQLDFAIVEDIAKEGAFENAVVSDPPFEAVVHTASPFHFNVTNVKTDLLDPAVIGTTGILKSIKKNAPSVKNVVITSSFASVVDPSKGAWPEHTYTDSDWNPMTLEDAEQSPQAGYRASKVFAEKAAWEFVEKEKPNFALTTLCPPLVFGPVNEHFANLESLNTSNQRMWGMLDGKMKGEVAATGTFIWIDVRDLALLHVQSFENEKAANQRYFVTAGHFCNDDIVAIMRKNFPAYEQKLPTSEAPGGSYPEGGWAKVNTEKAEQTFGIKWKSLEACVVDTVKSLQKVGA